MSLKQAYGEERKAKLEKLVLRKMVLMLLKMSERRSSGRRWVERRY
jgi:hypothetical protein